MEGVRNKVLQAQAKKNRGGRWSNQGAMAGSAITAGVDLHIGATL